LKFGVNVVYIYYPQLPLLFLDRDFNPFVDHLGLESALRET